VVQSQPWANSSQDPILKRPIAKRTGGGAQDVDPEFKPQHCKKKKKKKKICQILLIEITGTLLLA
jgi:hypothetical protein